MRFGPDWRTLSSAVLIAAALPPWDLELVIFVALVPWLSRLRTSHSYRHSVVQGFWLSFCTGLLTAHWMSVAVHEFLGQIAFLPLERRGAGESAGFLL